MGSASGSIKSYLENLHPPAGARVGVFGYGGVEKDNADQALIVSDVASLPAGSILDIRSAIKLTQQDGIDKGCADFVARLLQ